MDATTETEGTRSIIAVTGAGAINPVRGDAPELDWLRLDQLVVNEAYQRNLSDRSRKLVRRIAENWDWAQVKALNVMRRDDGRFEVRDGQHTAIAALTRGDIPELPALIMPLVAMSESASAFVGLNSSRTALTAMNLFAASAAGGDETALAVIEGARRAGAEILKRMPASNAAYAPGSTVAVAALLKLAKARGADGVERVLKIGVDARMAPIPTDFIKAAGALLWEPEYQGAFALSDLRDVLAETPWTEINKTAAEEAKRTRRPFIAALTTTLFKLVG